MPRRMSRHQGHVPKLDPLAVSDRVTRVSDRLPCWDDQRGAGDPAQLGGAGDVVVVDVRLDDVGQPRAPIGQQPNDTVDVALRVDDDGTATGEDCVAPVAELRGLDGCDLRGHSRTIPHARAIGMS